MNKAILIGRLTREPELRTTGNATSVCSFTLAVNRRFKNAEGNYDADFINCVAWRNHAELIYKHVGKGDMLGIVGNIQTRNYEKDGSKIYITEVVVEEIHFVGSKKETDKPAESMNDFPDLPLPADDDMPF